ncbi:jerky protein homolog-like [Terrapene carolina triunguis]|uniref:jerky protein homolog-like n=1 Tax=Terrapene triunguis TaxID=2587831 RepID=UPI000E776F3F|nr:jerky protein homolog-like [Terrapene carolina triunguis]
MWFTQEHSEGTLISSDIIRKQAKKLKKDLDFRRSGEDTSAHQGNEFKASSGWLNHFLKCHGIWQVAISGETCSADIKACDEYPLKLQEIIIKGGYAPEQIYNADETGLCYRMLPDRTLASRTEEQKAKGIKVIKERVTILFCVNKTSLHKLKPLCIGKSRSPRAFHHKNMDSLSFIHRHSKNAWMTSDIFEEWFKKYFVPAVRNHLRRQNLEPKALLLLDNCPAHPPVETLTSKDGKIKMSYLSKNTTSKIQPLDQGIIATFKMNYHKALVNKLNLLDVFNLGETAWLGITPSTIEKCWHRGLKSAFVTESDDNQDKEEDEDENNFEGFMEEEAMEAERVYRELMAQSGIAVVQEWMEVDAICPTYERLTDVDIIHNVAPQPPGASESVSNPEDSDEEPLEPPPKAADAVVGLEIGLKWLESQDVDRLQILQIKSIIDLAKAAARSSMKQQSITIFFLN